MDAKMKELMEAKKYYEFGQYIKGAMSRKIARKKYDEYDALIKEALQQLIIIKEENMIIDIGEDYLFNYKKYNKEFNQAFADFVIKVFLNGRRGRRVQYLEKVIYQTEGKIKEFYSVLSDAYMSAKEYQKAYRYAIKSQQLEKFYPLLNELIKMGNPSEKDLFICRAVLEFLCAEQNEHASMILARYSGEFKSSPLYQFTQWILHALKIKSLNAFKEIIVGYSQRWKEMTI